MKITWLSPSGAGWSVAYKLREAGNKVVYFNLARNGNGRGFLPEANPADWAKYARKSDLLFVDETPASRRTRRGGFEASDISLELARLRHEQLPVIGPTPTTELMQNDPRYQRKVLARMGLTGVEMATGLVGETNVRCTISRGPLGLTSLTFRDGKLDFVVPIGIREMLTQRLESLYDFTGSIGHSSYLNMDLTVFSNGMNVERILAEPLYPGGFCHLGDLLGTAVLRAAAENGESLGAGHHQPPRPKGLAVTLYRLDDDPPATIEGLIDQPGFFGCEVHRAEGENAETRPHGLLAGAFVGGEFEWSDLTSKIEPELSRARGLGWRCDIGQPDRVAASIEQLRHWGWLS